VHKLSEIRPINSNTLGADLRALRKARRLTLAELADKLDRSVGWMSQVERDISIPTIADLRELAAVLDVSVSSLAHTGAVAGEEGLIVRKDARRPIGSRAPGLVESLLSPDLTDDYEVLHSTFAPGAHIPLHLSRETTEIVYFVCVASGFAGPIPMTNPARRSGSSRRRCIDGGRHGNRALRMW